MASMKSAHEVYTAQDLDLLSDFPVSVGDGTADIIVTSGAGDEVEPVNDMSVLVEDHHHSHNNCISSNNSKISAGMQQRFTDQDMHAISSQIGDVTADEDDDDPMDFGNDDDDGSAFANDQNLMDEDGEDEAMQFETVANKMFQSETEVVPLPIVVPDQQDPGGNDRSNSSTAIVHLNNSQQITSGKAVPITGTSASSSSFTSSSNLLAAKANAIPAKTTSNSTGNAVPQHNNNSSSSSSNNNSVNSNTIILSSASGQAMTSAADLSSFINAIRPPSIPGVTLQQQQQQQQKQQPLTQIILQKGSTGVPVANAAGLSGGIGVVKKQIAPASVTGGGIQILNASSLSSAGNLSAGGPYKVIMTSGGQQILLNASDLCNLQAAVNKSSNNNSSSGAGGSSNITIVKSDAQPVTAVASATLPTGSQAQKAILSTGSGGQQQIVFLSSPLKPGSTGQVVKVANVSGSGTIQQIASGSSSKNLVQGTSGSVRLIQATNSGTVNQLTKDGKNLQVIRLVTTGSAPGKVISSSATSLASGGTSLRTIAPSPGQKTFLIPASAAGKAGGLTNLIANSAQQILATTTTSGNQQVIMLPAAMLQQGAIIKSATGQNIIPKVSIQSSSSANISQQHVKSYVPIAPSPMSGHVATIHPSSREILSSLTKQQQQQHQHQQQHLNGPIGKSVTIGASTGFPGGGLTAEDLSRQRKPCNCTKSQCLKLYCDCFANGEFCKDCNCNNCNNNLEHEEERQKAVRQCLERNPHAFQPKIGKGRITGDVPERRHTKGCNCRRSGCLKNYCECYEAKILCSELCKCCGCKNYEDSFERKSLQLMNLAEAAEYRSAQQTAASKLIWGPDYQAKLPIPLFSNDRFPCSFISNDVIDAACRCLMATVEENEQTGVVDYATIESALILEFGRCLTQIIDSAKTKT